MNFFDDEYLARMVQKKILGPYDFDTFEGTKFDCLCDGESETDDLSSEDWLSLYEYQERILLILLEKVNAKIEYCKTKTEESN